jgi:hypothetical protein
MIPLLEPLRAAALRPFPSAGGAFWSAVTRQRFFRGDLSPSNDRGWPEKWARSRLAPAVGSALGFVAASASDGDKLPAQSGDESPHSKSARACSPAHPLPGSTLRSGALFIPNCKDTWYNSPPSLTRRTEQCFPPESHMASKTSAGKIRVCNHSRRGEMPVLARAG